MTSTESSEVTTGDRRSEIAAHTPGPWCFNRHTRGTYFADIQADLGIKDGVGQIRTVGLVLKYAPESEREANANLIAAAPDLLAALIAAEPGLSDLVGQNCPDPDVRARDEKVYAQVVAAIAKATTP